MVNFKELQYEPIDDRILVQPGEVKKIKSIDYSPANLPVEDKKLKNLKPGKVKMEEKEVEVRTAFRIGTILKGQLVERTLQGENVIAKEGDIIVYQDGRGILFDLMIDADDKETRDSGPIWLKRYDIFGLVNNYKETNNEESKESN